MEAGDIIARVVGAINRRRLDAVMIGNAGAALHGAPVTTIDIDFLIRDAPANRRKVTAIAADLGATLYRPHYPVSTMQRVMKDDESLQIDFMETVSGVRSFEVVRKRSEYIQIRGVSVRVAGLADIIKMKRAANRPQDRAVLEILEMTLEETKAQQTAEVSITKKGK